MAVALFDIDSPLRPLREQIDAAIAAVVASGRFILGPEVDGFEREFAAYTGTRHAIGVANGTDALTIALRALGVGPGDDVVVPSFTYFASAEAIVPTGARPVFCDVDAATGCVSADTVSAALTPRTKAVIAVHLFGNVAPVAQIEALGVPVVEDAAQAAGTRSAQGRPGALGRIATFSFFPSKNLGCFGDGGAITTDDAQLDERVRMLRFHGSADAVTHELVGCNSRLDALQAAILRVLLPQLDAWSAGRRAAAAAYEAAGLGELVALPVAAPDVDPAWHLYVVRHARADALAAGLAERGIGCKTYYRTPVHRQPAMREIAAGVRLPVTDELARTHLALPMSPLLSEAQAAEVVDAVREVLAGDAARPGRPAA
jgi:dTDP-3-amino-3,4,6-trideoxy-alpha-D-glucose transaminase